jgi:hypothetical protein
MPTLSFIPRGQSEAGFFTTNGGTTAYREAALVAAGNNTTGAGVLASEVTRRLPGWTARRLGELSPAAPTTMWGGTSFVDDWIDPRLGPADDAPLTGNADPRIGGGRFGGTYMASLDALIVANNATTDAWATIWYRQTWESDDRIDHFGAWPFNIVEYARAVTLFVTLEAAKLQATGKPWRILAVHPGPTDRGGLRHALMREVVQHLAANGRRSARASLAGFAPITGFHVGGTAINQLTFAVAQQADTGTAGTDFAHQSLGSSQRSARQLAVPIARWLAPAVAQEFDDLPRVQSAARVSGSPNLIRCRVTITPGNRLVWQGPDALDTDVTPAGGLTGDPTIGHIMVHAAPIDDAATPPVLNVASVAVSNATTAAGHALLDITLDAPVPASAFVSIGPGNSATGYTRRSEAIAPALKRKLGLYEDATPGRDLVVDAALSDLLRTPVAVAMPVLNITNLPVLEGDDTLSSLSDTAETMVLNWLLTNATVTRPTAWFAALGTAGNDSSFTELSGGAYGRVAAPMTVTGGLASNAGAIVFPTPTAGWGQVTHVAIFDAASGGTRLAQGPLAAPVNVATGEAPRFTAGALDLSLD